MKCTLCWHNSEHSRKPQALRNYASIIGSLTNLVCALGGKTLTRSQIHPIFLLKHQSATGGEIMNPKYHNGLRHANATHSSL